MLGSLGDRRSEKSQMANSPHSSTSKPLRYYLVFHTVPGLPNSAGLQTLKFIPQTAKWCRRPALLAVTSTCLTRSSAGSADTSEMRHAVMECQGLWFRFEIWYVPGHFVLFLLLPTQLFGKLRSVLLQFSPDLGSMSEDLHESLTKTPARQRLTGALPSVITPSRHS